MNPSLAYIRSSDGSGDASLMTITQVRTAPATTITVNTVAGASTNFFATMGTPHTFNDPVTGETITTISEATAVSFAGRIDSGKIEIVAIAPGETDLGSKVGDIIIIRPTTQWANNIHGVLSKSLNDDGTLKDKAVTLPNINGGGATGILTADANGEVSVAPTFPSFSAYASANITISPTTPTKLVFNTIESDNTNGAYSTSTGRFTCNRAGKYVFTAAYEVSCNPGERYFITLYKNGAEWKRGNSLISGGSGIQNPSLVVVPPPIDLAVGDYIEVFAYNGSGGAKSVSSGKNVTYFGGWMQCA